MAHTTRRKLRMWPMALCFTALATGPAVSVSAEDQAWVGLEDMAQLLRSDARMIVMGDSFSVAWFFRVPPAGLRIWPIPNITAIEGGVKQYHDLMRGLALSNQASAIEFGDPDGLGYTVERAEAPPKYFALPVRSMREFHANEDMVLGPNNRLLEFRVQNYRFEPGVHGPFSTNGDSLRFRMLYRCASDLALQLPSISLQNYNGDLMPMDLHFNARGFHHYGDDLEIGHTAVPGQINATFPDIDVNNDVADLLRIRLSTDPAYIGSDTYLDVAGGVYYHVDQNGQRLPGLYYSYLADDSWSYLGFCSDAEATSAFDKRFSREQLTHWLDATTLDPAQPAVFTRYLAPEELDFEEALSVYRQMVDTIDEIGQDIGLHDVRHLLIISHMYYFSNGVGDGPQAHDYMLAQQNAAFMLAKERSNVAAASIYAATDAMLFDGRQEGVDWLQEHGFADFHFRALQADLVNPPVSGTLLDGIRVHPLGEEGAGFFAAILGDLIREAGCPSDFVTDGVIDISDLLAVIGGWNKPSDMDLDGDGLLGIVELLAVLDQWGDCWPVQAPFDTAP